MYVAIHLEPNAWAEDSQVVLGGGWEERHPAQTPLACLDKPSKVHIFNKTQGNLA
jgi:hypothetical protein